LQPEDFVVGTIARLVKLKGHDDLFAVAPELVRRCPQIKFLLVGDGAYRTRFEALARSLKLERHFVFTGLVPPDDVPSLVGIMDALVHLSLREGLPRALPQALAAAKPVRSPTTPPPSATTTSFRSNPDSLKNVSACSSERIDLCCSPSFINQTLQSKPDERSARKTFSPNRSNTFRFEIKAARRVPGPSTLRAASPSSP